MTSKEMKNMLCETRENVGNIMGWIIVVTLHQKWGIGRDRLNRISLEIERVNKRTAAVIAEGGRRKAEAMLRDELGKAVSRDNELLRLDFRLPVLRAPKNRVEEQLRMAGNETTQLVWLIYATAIRRTARFGAERLNRLRQQVWDNYAQMNEWNAQDRDLALERLKMMAESAIRESLTAVDGNPEKRNPIQDGLDNQEALEKLIRNTRRAAVKNTRPAPAGVPDTPLVVGNGLTKWR